METGGGMRMRKRKSEARLWERLAPELTGANGVRGQTPLASMPIYIHIYKRAGFAAGYINHGSPIDASSWAWLAGLVGWFVFLIVTTSRLVSRRGAGTGAGGGGSGSDVDETET